VPVAPPQQQAPTRPPEGAAAPAPRPEPEHEEPSQLRLRGGFSVNGGLVHTPDGNGPAFGLAARLGVQINSYFAFYYQNTPLVTFAPTRGAQSAGFHAGFADYNTLLASLTVLDVLEIAAGPSIDYAKYADCSAGVTGFTPTAGCESGSSVAFGGHARVALVLGGLFGSKDRRSGFSIGADIHPLLASDVSAYSATLGIGAEWY
jgi:hypothetical protein